MTASGTSASAAADRGIGRQLIRDLIKPLSDYAVEIRYPGDEPNRAEAKHAIRAMDEARKFIRERLK